MLAKLSTYNSLNYAGTLGAGLIWSPLALLAAICSYVQTSITVVLTEIKMLKKRLMGLYQRFNKPMDGCCSSFLDRIVGYSHIIV